MAERFPVDFISYFAEPVAPGDLTVTLPAAPPAGITTGDWRLVTVTSNAEIMKVTGVAGAVLTVERSAEPVNGVQVPGGIAHPRGEACACGLTNAAFQALVGAGGVVTSVFTRTGAVTAQNGDYTAAQVGADPSGSAATAMAMAELYADAKVSDTAYDATAWNGVTGIAPSKNAVRDIWVTLGSAAFTASSAYDASGAAAAAQAASQPLDADLTAIASLTTTAFGRDFLTMADAAASRTYIGAASSTVSAASKLLGRGSAGGAGAVEEIAISTGLVLAGTTLRSTPVGTTLPSGNILLGDGSDSAQAVPLALTGPITSTGLATAVASQTGTGTTFVMNTSPTLVTPVLGVAAATRVTVTGGGTQNSSDCSFLSLRSFDDTGTGSGHGFADNTLITRSNGAPFGYASFDARGNTTGAVNYDHHNGYQFFWNYAAGTLLAMAGFTSAPTHDGGLLNNVYHHLASDIAGSGNVTSQYGFYCASMTRGGTNNFNFWSDGTAKSRFSGITQFQAGIQVNGGSLIVDSTANIGLFGTLGVGAVFLSAPSANNLLQSNGASAQIHRIANTYTSASVNETLSLGWSGNVALIQTTHVGASARAMTIGPAQAAACNLQTNGAVRWGVNTSAQWICSEADGTRSIGASNSSGRPSTIFVKAGLDVTQGTLPASTVAVNTSATFNDGAVTFTHKLTAITNTASAAASTLDKYTVGGTTKFQIGVTGLLSVAAGGSTGLVKVGGSLFDHYADGASTNTNGTDDTLYTDTVAASVLDTVGNKISFEFKIVVNAASTAAETIKWWFGGTSVTLVNAANFTASGVVIIRGFLIVDTATSIRYSITAIVTNTTITVGAPTSGTITGLTLTNSQVLKITGATSGTGAAAGDVTAKCGFIEWKPAA